STILPMDILKAFLVVLALVVIDVLLGIVLSIKQGNFNIRTLPRFIQQSILPYVGGLLILALGASASPEIRALFFAAVAATTIKFLADLKDKLVGIFGPSVQAGQSGTAKLLSSVETPAKPMGTTSSSAASPRPPNV
ncbi:MAG: hypothetical protein ACYCX4_17435, partial [Bacillota bacterium]